MAAQQNTKQEAEKQKQQSQEIRKEERKRSPRFKVPTHETEHAAGLAAWLRPAACRQVSELHLCSASEFQLPTLRDKVHQIALGIGTNHLDSAEDSSDVLCMGRMGSASNERKVHAVTRKLGHRTWQPCLQNGFY